jgi:hypothetical protein
MPILPPLSILDHTLTPPPLSILFLDHINITV